MMFDKKTSTENLSTPVNVEDVIPGEHIVLSSGQRWQGFQSGDRTGLNTVGDKAKN